ncbi:MAG: hypothetical protein WC509_08440 [Candidatus Izemoplasmatales bacterium]
MKRLMIVLGTVAVLVAAGFAIRNTVAAEDVPATTASTTSASGWYGPMMGGRGGYGSGRGCGYGYGIATTAAPSYEWLYLHLDADETALVDAYHADLIATYDFAAMDAENRLSTLAEIRTALADYILESGFVSGLNP